MVTIKKLDELDGRRLAFFENLTSQHFITTVDHGNVKPDLLSLGNTPFIRFLKIVFNTDRIITANVQHEDRIVLFNRKTASQVFLVDGLIYIHYREDKTPASVISATTGDCPYLLIEAENKNFLFNALIHCGWRGLSKKIIRRSIMKLNELGVKSSQIKVGLWTGINQSCYEVGPEVRKALGRYYHKSFFTQNEKRNRWLLDLAGIIKEQLFQHDVMPNQIEESGICPYCYHDQHGNPVFYSYRHACHQQNQQNLNKRNGIFMRLSI